MILDVGFTASRKRRSRAAGACSPGIPLTRSSRQGAREEPAAGPDVQPFDQLPDGCRRTHPAARPPRDTESSFQPDRTATMPETIRQVKSPRRSATACMLLLMTIPRPTIFAAHSASPETPHNVKRNQEKVTDPAAGFPWAERAEQPAAHENPGIPPAVNEVPRPAESAACPLASRRPPDESSLLRGGPRGSRAGRRERPRPWHRRGPASAHLAACDERAGGRQDKAGRKRHADAAQCHDSEKGCRAVIGQQVHQQFRHGRGDSAVPAAGAARPARLRRIAASIGARTSSKETPLDSAIWDKVSRS